MNVGQWEARLKQYPRETKVMILITTENGQRGIDIKDELLPTFIRPDVESVPSSIFLVPECELVKA